MNKERRYIQQIDVARFFIHLFIEGMIDKQIKKTKINFVNSVVGWCEQSIRCFERKEGIALSEEKGKTLNPYLTCERKWLFYLLICIAGYFGAYTYVLRGNIFCNAQTGNIVLMGIAFGSGDFNEGIYYLVPISAYLFGAFISEILPNPIKRSLAIRWDTVLIVIEIIVVIILGFLPESAPVQISQVAINFIASMQYNTFRQAEGIPMATTFATNHIRQIGVGLAKELHHRHKDDKKDRVKLFQHSKMLVCFIFGAMIGAYFCHIFLGKAIWITLIPFLFILIRLLYADLYLEKERMEHKPSGH